MKRKIYGAAFVLTVIVWMIAFTIAQAFAADDPRAQVELLQTALQICQQQRNEASDSVLNKTVPLVAEIQRLQKRVQELEDAAKVKK